MSEKRKSCASICLKTKANTPHKWELFPADLWAEGQPGLFRVRAGGCWMEGYHSAADIGAGVSRLIGQGDGPATPPSLPRGTRVRVPNGRIRFGRMMHDLTHVVTDAPLRDPSGRWWVGVGHPCGGVRLVPVEDVTPIE